ncbi:hypothetical protein Micbo1qcDRAFT_73077 [Microdochium bolleyi]|uniref:DUF7708 domain-containing protein n=1 Tax=Microdochium bolleyi TaxID=196109 RepID=A0A136IIF8_9PEZI|nr:hypothetical protein Micbo1qcDRAFT_73077 [Microdochium bolleyi]
MAGPLSSVSGPTALNHGLEDALAGFQAALSEGQREELHEIKKNHVIPDADAVLVFTARLDAINRQRRGKSTSTRLHSLLSSVADFCAVMTDGRPCNVADTLVSSNPEVAALVWGSVKFTMTAISNIMSYNDGMFNLLMDITKSCPVISEYRSLYPDSTRLQEALSCFYAAIIRCCQHLMEQVMQRREFFQAAKNFVGRLANQTALVTASGSTRPSSTCSGPLQTSHRSQDCPPSPGPGRPRPPSSPRRSSSSSASSTNTEQASSRPSTRSSGRAACSISSTTSCGTSLAAARRSSTSTSACAATSTSRRTWPL